MGLDLTMVAVGEFGKYQRRIFTLLCLVGIPFSLFETGPVFWAFIPSHKCNDSHDGTQGLIENDGSLTIDKGIAFSSQEADDKLHEPRIYPQDVFRTVLDESCFAFSLGKDGNVSERRICSNYSFEVAETSIVSRVSTVRNSHNLCMHALCLQLENQVSEGWIAFPKHSVRRTLQSEVQSLLLSCSGFDFPGVHHLTNDNFLVLFPLFLSVITALV